MARGGEVEARALFARRDPKPRAQAASEHTEDEVRDTLKPIAEILREAGEWERAARVTREWVGVSAAPDAPEAFCELLEASPVVIPFALEFTLDTKRHWFRRHKLDRRTVDRILLAIAAEEHRRAAVVRVSLGGRKIGGGVPAELVRLTNLEVVDLSWNELTGRSRSRMLRSTLRALRCDRARRAAAEGDAAVAREARSEWWLRQSARVHGRNPDGVGLPHEPQRAEHGLL